MGAVMISNTFKNSLAELLTLQEQGARKSEPYFSTEYNDIINAECYHQNRIERLLDNLLDFCFDDNILNIFKKLCRYYYNMYVSSKSWQNSFLHNHPFEKYILLPKFINYYCFRTILPYIRLAKFNSRDSKIIFPTDRFAKIIFKPPLELNFLMWFLGLARGRSKGKQIK